MNIQAITLGGGCFWCLEAVFERVDGVVAVESGYANGQLERPRYEQVCRGDTGHAEVVRVEFDADRITLRELLEIFFAVHDPTSKDRQGADVGPQYRSAVYWHQPAQEAEVRAARDEADRSLGGRVVTELQPLARYWRAEDGHQRYYANNPGEDYCAYVVAPRLWTFGRRFRSRLRRA